MINPRVKEVVATDDYKLILTFKDDKKAVYDCGGLLGFGVFRELQDINYFKQAFILHGTVVWSHEQDICPDTLYLDSKRLE